MTGAALSLTRACVSTRSSCTLGECDMRPISTPASLSRCFQAVHSNTIQVSNTYKLFCTQFSITKGSLDYLHQRFQLFVCDIDHAINSFLKGNDANETTGLHHLRRQGQIFLRHMKRSRLLLGTTLFKILACTKVLPGTDYKTFPLTQHP
jgi:hypothetical protein